MDRANLTNYSNIHDCLFFRSSRAFYNFMNFQKLRKKIMEQRVVTKQKVTQSQISFSMLAHIYGKHNMKSEPFGMTITYFFFSLKHFTSMQNRPG